MTARLIQSLRNKIAKCDEKIAEQTNFKEKHQELIDVLIKHSPPLPATAEKQPPVDNDHVEEGAEKFSDEVIAANNTAA